MVYYRIVSMKLLELAKINSKPDKDNKYNDHEGKV